MSKTRQRTVSHSQHKRSPTRIIISHGAKKRSLTFKPWLAIAGGAGCVLLIALYVSATGYLVFRDGVMSRSAVEQTWLRLPVDDGMTELRAEIDRFNERAAIDTGAVANAVEKLLGRQAALDARQDLIVDLRAMARRAGIEVTGPVPPSPSALAVPLAPDLTLLTGGIQVATSAPDQPPAGLALRGNTEAPVQPALGSEDQIAAVGKSLDDIERQQIAFVRAVSGSIAQQTRQIASVLDGLGQNVATRPAKRPTREGGPYVPAAHDANGVAFRDGITAIADGIAMFQAAREAARTLPLARPVATEATSSGFGERSDPFLGYTAMHEGIDFLAEQGAPVAATAPGVVTAAGPNGGYGNMVEIDHGNGVVTRYGHLSQILVKVGAKTVIGTIIGKVGSTGRSTGPHLHYEVRRKDRAINPSPFLRAGGTLRAIL